MAGDPIVWWELATHDAEKSVAFFEKVFGWDLPFNEQARFHLTRADSPPGQRAVGGDSMLTNLPLPRMRLRP